MGKDKHKRPYFLVPIPYIPEEEKEEDPSEGKPPYPTVRVQPIFNGRTTEQFFKWCQSLIPLIDGQKVGEHFHLALQALRGTDKALWPQEMDLTSPELAEAAGLSVENAEKLWYEILQSWQSKF
jgi:hypothetical protein